MRRGFGPTLKQHRKAQERWHQEVQVEHARRRAQVTDPLNCTWDYYRGPLHSSLPSIGSPTIEGPSCVRCYVSESGSRANNLIGGLVVSLDGHERLNEGWKTLLKEQNIDESLLNQ
jgi:hypothetical protein